MAKPTGFDGEVKQQPLEWSVQFIFFPKNSTSLLMKSISSSNWSGGQALGTVALGLGGVVVDLDHQAVGTGGHGSLCQLGHHPCMAAGVAGVHYDGQVGHLVEHDHTGQIKGVAHAGLEGADAALAEDDVLVALGHDVFGAHDELFQRVGKAPLEQHRLFSDGPQP